MITIPFFLVSCSDGGGEAPHVHSFSDDWKSSDVKHWHEATCGHDLVSAFGDHEWDDGYFSVEPQEEVTGEKTFTCTVCSKTKVEDVDALPHTHKFESTLTAGDEKHWYASTCGHDVKKDEADHNWNEGEPYAETVAAPGGTVFTCTDCGKIKDEIAPRKTYSITYNNITGATNSNVSSYTIADTISLSKPKKTDYIFAGWFTDSSLTQPFTASWSAGEKSENLILYAKWLTDTIVNNASTSTIQASSLTQYAGLDVKMHFIGACSTSQRSHALYIKYGSETATIDSGTYVGAHTHDVTVDHVFTIDKSSVLKITSWTYSSGTPDYNSYPISTRFTLKFVQVD